MILLQVVLNFIEENSTNIQENSTNNQPNSQIYWDIHKFTRENLKNNSIMIDDLLESVILNDIRVPKNTTRLIIISKRVQV